MTLTLLFFLPFFLVVPKLKGNDLLFYIVFGPEPTFYRIERNLLQATEKMNFKSLLVAVKVKPAVILFWGETR